MKRIYFILWLCLVSGIIAAQSTKELHLFHTNDMHSRIEPLYIQGGSGNQVNERDAL